MSVLRTLPLVLVAIAFVGACCSPAGAGPIANWKQLNSGVTAATSDLNTDSPTYGDGSDANAQSAFVAGRFGTVGVPETVSLSVGETLTVSGDIVLTGGASGDVQYRFGVFNDGGGFAANDPENWVGGWLHVAGDDLFDARTDGVYLSTAGNANDLGAVLVSSGSLNKDSPVPLTWTMSVTRDSATTVDIVSTLVGGGGGLNQTMTADDVTTSNFTYTTAGWLFGGTSSLDQATFSNVQFNVTPVPEPATFGLSAIGFLGLAFYLLRRRS